MILANGKQLFVLKCQTTSLYAVVEDLFLSLTSVKV